MKFEFAMFAVISVFTLFSGLSFADIGPGPSEEELSHITLNVTYNGGEIPADMTIFGYCNWDNATSPVTTFGTGFTCNGTICTNNGWYKLSPCATGNESVVLEFTGPIGNGSMRSDPLRIVGGKTILYKVELSNTSASILEVSLTDNVSGEVEEVGLCGLAPYLLILGFAGMLFVRKE